MSFCTSPSIRRLTGILVHLFLQHPLILLQLGQSRFFIANTPFELGEFPVLQL
jgi:hypothetical protein